MPIRQAAGKGGIFLFTGYSALPTVALPTPAPSSWGLAAAMCALSCSHDSASWHPVAGHTGMRGAAPAVHRTTSAPKSWSKAVTTLCGTSWKQQLILSWAKCVLQD